MFLLKKKPSSFFCLNAAQFLGALNDNIYKLLTIFFLISTLGVDKSSTILSVVGALYVIPFLLFSAAAGVLADRFSKQRIIVGLKAFEILLMVLSLLVFYYKSSWGCYSLLFLLASHSAVFGPSKYGIIAELVDKQKITKANGLVTSFTYLAIISGTFLASFFTEFTGKNYLLSVGFCLLFALAGFFFSLCIKKTEAQQSSKKIKLFFPKEIIQTISESRKTPLLAPCLFGSAFFLFIGAFTQLNIIPFAIQSLKLSEYAGGYLFLLSALGIAGGSLLAGKLLRKKAELGLSCFAGFIIGILFFSLWFFSSYLIPTAIALTLLGVFGGIFVISFDSFIQTSSSSQQRGQSIAAANFLSFFGVLIASASLYLFGAIMGLSPALGFLCMSFLTFTAVFFLSCRLLEVTLPFISRVFRSQELDISTFKNTSIFLAETFSFELLWKVAFLSSHCQIMIQERKDIHIPIILRLAPNVLFINTTLSLKDALKKTKEELREGNKAYLFHQDAALIESLRAKESLLSFGGDEVCLIYLEKKKNTPILHIKKHSISL
jgi:acyl-[acyl-carrier-protein]-phospholipid O-acyltransferase / long-chain-fatty-acid--[acyl-carrier-protein] ligase